jgi:hypothetical protein
MKQAVTLSLEEDIYKKYQDYCVKYGLNLSRQVEIAMEKALKMR